MVVRDGARPWSLLRAFFLVVRAGIVSYFLPDIGGNIAGKLGQCNGFGPSRLHASASAVRGGRQMAAIHHPDTCVRVPRTRTASMRCLSMSIADRMHVMVAALAEPTLVANLVGADCRASPRHSAAAFFHVALVSAARQEADPIDRSRRGSMRVSWSLLR